MDKKQKIQKAAYYVIGLCVLLLIVVLVSELVKTQNALEESNTLTQQLYSEIQEKELSAEESGTSLETYKNEYDKMQVSISELQADYEEAQKQLAREELYEARAALLAKDKGNDYREEVVFEKIVYLTFDDGPSERTLDILETLDKYNVKATFFVNYHDDAQEQGIYKMIVDQGHSIGNHTYDHSYPVKDWDAFLESLFKMEDFIFEETGVRTRIIRFPGGSSAKWSNYKDMTANVQALCDMGYIYFDWNLTNHDADADMGYINEDRMMEILKLEAPGRDKLMLLMHDRQSKYATAQALDDIIKYFMDRGYVFLPITQYSFNPQHFVLPQQSAEEQK